MHLSLFDCIRFRSLNFNTVTVMRVTSRAGNLTRVFDNLDVSLDE